MRRGGGSNCELPDYRSFGQLPLPRQPEPQQGTKGGESCNSKPFKSETNRRHRVSGLGPSDEDSAFSGSPRARVDHIATGVPARPSTSMRQDPEQGTMAFNNAGWLIQVCSDTVLCLFAKCCVHRVEETKHAGIASAAT